jgi:hypothetical protein
MSSRAYAIVLASAGLAASLLAGAGFRARASEATFCVTCKGPDETYVCKVNGDLGGQTDALKLYCVVRTAKEGGHASCSARDDVAGCNGATKTYSYDVPDLPAAIASDPRVKKFNNYVAREQKKFSQDDKPSQSLVAMSRRGIRNLRASLGGEEEPKASAPPQQQESLQQERLPELPGQSAPPLPLSASPEKSVHAGLPAETTAPPSEKRSSRVRRGAQSVGNFTRKSYRCVRSLFRHCGGDEENAESN